MLHLILLLSLSFQSQMPSILSTTFTLTNNCAQTIWPGILANAGSTPPASTGFALNPSTSRSIVTPAPWSGRFWARTLCSTDQSGRFTCASGDCGSGTVECSGGGAAPPTTLAEFTLAGGDGTMDFYDVSLVDGYNIAMLVEPNGSSASACAVTGCVAELNGACPVELKVGAGIACKSACEAFGTDEYCCNGVYGNPNACKPTVYSEFFKRACPRAYSYAYDDATSTFTCSSADSYVITFCPGLTTRVKSEGRESSGIRPLINDSMVFLGVRTSSAVAKDVTGMVIVGFGYLLVWVCYDR
ncbi:thaumatin-like protein 1 [Dioscorea cayenensis subsp. rotundata]|uniref:Thaumatin-like protein 1 n=1 Tax=Dioscorea cayennensis subsp. rotundata TaxID=55577 RepID=A0AB40C6E8_DIOCR|nr:thaumatin-like protein 1 [Dioscorea cayenensis subsp. rotundata]